MCYTYNWLVKVSIICINQCSQCENTFECNLTGEGQHFKTRVKPVKNDGIKRERRRDDDGIKRKDRTRLDRTAFVKLRDDWITPARRDTASTEFW